MKIDRVILIRRARDEQGLKWKVIGGLLRISITRVRNIYSNNKSNRVQNLSSNNALLTRPQLQ